MKHYGDITKLSGYELPVVDVITGGSPCQDLSVAGKRLGLEGERSGLFMDQVRIVKEMREHDMRSTGRTGQYVRPRFMVWENVPGALSSNKGKDFQAVLTEIVKIVEPDADDVPMPDKGKWPHAGCIYDNLGGWSVAWRVHDAQFWGVPQRRKRIALVADFGGLCAGEVLFERKGLSWNPEQSGEAWEGTSAGTESGSGRAISFQERAGKPGGGKVILIQNEHVGALSTTNNQSVFRKTGHPRSIEEGQGYEEAEVSDTLNAFDNTQGRTPTLVTQAAGFSFGQSAKARSIGYQEERSPTLRGGEGGNMKPCVITNSPVGCDVYNQTVTGDVAATLTEASGGQNNSGPKVIV